MYHSLLNIGIVENLPPFHGGNTSSILVRVTKERPLHFFDAGVFFFLSFLPRDSVPFVYNDLRKRDLHSLFIEQDADIPVEPAPCSEDIDLLAGHNKL